MPISLFSLAALLISKPFLLLSRLLLAIGQKLQTLAIGKSEAQSEHTFAVRRSADPEYEQRNNSHCSELQLQTEVAAQTKRRPAMGFLLFPVLRGNSPLAFSPDGRQVLTGSADGTAKLWDAATGLEVRSFHGHTDSVLSVAFSPDGRQVLTGSRDGTAKLWDSATERPLWTADGHTWGARCVAFSPDGSLVAVASCDDGILLRHAQTGEPCCRIDIDPEETQIYQETCAILSQPEGVRSAGGRRWLLLVSLALFIAAGFLAGYWEGVLDLAVVIGVLFLHETGHYLAMRVLGYSDLSIHFIPFFGAAAAGRKYGASKWQQALVLISGPLPGIALGALLFAGFGAGAKGTILAQVIAGLILINGFNLLPITPLDGGRLLNLVLFSRNSVLEILFLALSTVALAIIAWLLRSWVLILAAVVIAIFIPTRYREARRKREVRETLGDLAPRWEELNEEERRLLFRVVLLGGGLGSTADIAQKMRELHEEAVDKPASIRLSVAVLATYTTAVIACALIVSAHIKDARATKEFLLAEIDWCAYTGAINIHPSRVAYSARIADKCYVVVDGKPGKPYDDIWGDGIVFDGRAKRLAYVARLAEKWFVVLDGKEQKHYDSVKNLCFSPDGNQLAYAALIGHKWFTVVNGEEHNCHDDIGWILFSSQGKSLAYTCRVGTKWFVVVDGKEQKHYDSVKELCFSPDGKQLAYAARVGDKWLTVVDGHEQSQYDGIWEIVFSSDGQRMAYAARRANQCFVVRDGEEQKAYDAVQYVKLSPDGQRLAYLAKSADKWFVVLDGKEHKPYDDVLPINFSPDGKHYAYGAGVGDSMFVVIDGRKGKRYKRVQDVLFAGPDCVFYVARVGNRISLVVETVK